VPGDPGRRPMGRRQPDLGSSRPRGPRPTGQLPAGQRRGSAPSAALVHQALDANPLFVSAALPHTVILPPLFNRYERAAMRLQGLHVDNAIRQRPGSSGRRLRTDLSATLFLAEPEDYDGGELVVEDDLYGDRRASSCRPAIMVLYPSSQRLHHVTPVTRGRRACRASSGSRAWSATTPTATTLLRARRRHPARRRRQGRGRSDAGGPGADRPSITTCCGAMGRGLKITCLMSMFVEH
jgi:hypothetical protein